MKRNWGVDPGSFSWWVDFYLMKHLWFCTVCFRFGGEDCREGFMAERFLADETD